MTNLMIMQHNSQPKHNKDHKMKRRWIQFKIDKIKEERKSMMKIGKK